MSGSPHEAEAVGLLNLCAFEKVDNSGFLSNTISVLDLNDAILLILQVNFSNIYLQVHCLHVCHVFNVIDW